MKTREIKFRAWQPQIKEMWKHYQINFDAAFTLHAAEQLTLLQYTGIKDKNGVEIYEGDIVVTAWHWDEPHLIELPDDYYDFQEYALDSEELEVLGNIYENPELLRGS